MFIQVTIEFERTAHLISNETEREREKERVRESNIHIHTCTCGDVPLFCFCLHQGLRHGTKLHRNLNTNEIVIIQ